MTTRQAHAALLGDLLELHSASAWSMGISQYATVLVHMFGRERPRVLIIGCGADSPLYVKYNPEGETLFLEHDAEWIQKNPGIPCLRVQYESRLSVPLEPCRPPVGSEPVLDRAWDCVLVDGPPGFRPEHHGRQQSIYLAAKVVAPDGIVLVHDHHRAGERYWAARYLGQPFQVVQEPRRGDLAVFRASTRPPPSRI